jgi:hypothetical protein
LNIFYSKLKELVYTINVPEWLYVFANQYAQNYSFALLFSVAVISGIGLVGTLLVTASRISIEIDPKNFRLTWWLLGFCYQKVQGQTQDINQIKLSRIRLPLNKKQITSCMFRAKLSKHRFGLFLTQREKEWLVGEIGAFLAK